MTQQGAADMYMWLMAAWPQVIKSNSSEAFQNAKIRELFKTYEGYTDQEVSNAFQKWTDENEKYPTTKNIINEIKWARATKDRKTVDPRALYQMEWITEDGTEYMVAWYKEGKLTTNFTLEEFVNYPQNKNHLSPEEWERRYRIRRKEILAKCHT